MAAFTDEVQLTIRVGSDVSQPDANQKLRAFLRDAIRATRTLLPQPFPTEEQIATLTTPEARTLLQKVVRAFVRDAVRAQRVSAAEKAFVKPVRDAADESEDVA